MNKYKITTFSYGNSQAFIIKAVDMVQALQGGMVNQSEVVKIEFFDSTDIIDCTEAN